MNISNSDFIDKGKHPKQDFQVERIAFFSDAVFAIAITLLVIEFHPPIITKNTTYAELWEVLKELKWKFAALLFSFILIVNYWMRHHMLFRHIHNYNKQVIIANMSLLLPIIFFPFTTSFLYENLNSNNELMVIPYRFFLLNNIVAGTTLYFFYWTATKRYTGISYPIPKEEKVDFERKMNILTLSFIFIFFLSFISLQASYFGLFPIALYNLYNRFMPKKAVATKKDTHVEQNNSTTN